MVMMAFLVLLGSWFVGAMAFLWIMVVRVRFGRVAERLFTIVACLLWPVWMIPMGVYVVALGMKNTWGQATGSSMYEVVAGAMVLVGCYMTADPLDVFGAFVIGYGISMILDAFHCRRTLNT